MFCNKYKKKLKIITNIQYNQLLTNMQKVLLTTLYLNNEPGDIIKIYPSYLGISNTGFKSFIKNAINNGYIDILTFHDLGYVVINNKKEYITLIQLKEIV